MIESGFDEPDQFCVAFGPGVHAEAVAYYKGRAVADRRPEAVVLAADTLVALDGRIYGKPEDADDARRILTTLGGTVHQVITGVAMIHRTAGRRTLRHVSTLVKMRALNRDQMDAYIAGGQWVGKAGAYGIQDTDAPFVDRIEGSFSNGVGLPMELVKTMLADYGVRPGSA